MPTFPAVHNAQGLIETPQSQDTTYGGIIIPQIAITDVPKSMAGISRNVTGTTEVLHQFIPPSNSSLSRSVVDSTIHNPIPSSIDILADTAQVAMGGPNSSSLPSQRENETPPVETASPTFRIVNLTDRDTIKSTSSSSASNATPFQPSRLASTPSPAPAVLANTMDLPLSFDVTHATLASGYAPASSLGSLDGRNNVSELPRQRSLPSVIGRQSTTFQEPLIQPRPQGTIILAPSPSSKTGTPEVSHLIQIPSYQGSVHSVNAFHGSRDTEQNTVNTPVSPQVTPIEFPEPSHVVDGSGQTPVQGVIPLSSDTHSYLHLTTASSLRSRRTFSLPVSPEHVRQNLSLILSGPMLISAIRVWPTGIQPEDRPLRAYT